MIDGSCESNINVVIEENILSKNIHSHSVCCWWWSIASSFSQQNDEQIDVIKEIVLPEVSRLNDSVMDKK